MRRVPSTVGGLVGALLLFLSSCVSGKDENVNSDVTPTRVSSLSIVEERRQTIGLLLSFYDMLSKEFGVGEWEPLRAHAQIGENFGVHCPSGYASERYDLAIAGPLTPEKWKAALSRMYKLAKPLGFGSPKTEAPGKNGGQSAVFARPDGARILIRYRVKSLVRIDTGCAKGEVYEGWPAGTEAVPERLRTTGRHEDGNPPETWAPYSPAGSPSAAPTSSFVRTQTKGKE